MLNLIDLKMISEDHSWMTDDYSFVRGFQPYAQPTDNFLTLAQLKDAQEKSALICSQNDLVTKSVDILAEAIFKIDGQLFEDIKVGKSNAVDAVEDDFFLIGGRHRLKAILSTLTSVGNLLNTSLLGQNIRVELVDLGENLDRIHDLILSNNNSRRLSKSEKLFVKSQREVPLAEDMVERLEGFLAAGLSNKELIEYCSTYFRCKHSSATGLKPVTIDSIGKFLTSYILFGEKLVRGTSKVKDISAHEFTQIAEALWQYVEAEAQQVTLKAVNCKFIAKAAIEAYQAST